MPYAPHGPRIYYERHGSGEPLLFVLSQITVDTYIVAGIADHISPWEASYRTTQLLGSEPRFVLSTSGHIVAMVNPPGNDKANFKTNEANPEDPDQWLDSATTHEGSWWPRLDRLARRAVG